MPDEIVKWKNDEELHPWTEGCSQERILILVSRNQLYRTRLFQKIAADYDADVEMTRPGTRGGAATVSIFFSQLMRKKGTVHFQTWQDAVNWLENYIFEYNKEKQ